MVQKKFDLIKRLRDFNRPSIFQFILMGVGLVVGIMLFIFLSGFVSCWRLTSLPGIPLPKCSNAAAAPAAVNASGTPIGQTTTPGLSAPEVKLPPPWDGASRVTVMMVGLDYRDWVANQGPSRSDTMILLTIDPVSKTAGMVSIPRDINSPEVDQAWQ
jgi:hypothetical protein